MSKKTKTLDKKSQKASRASVSKSQSPNQSEVNQRLAVNPLSQFSLNEDELKLALVTAQYALRDTRQNEDAAIEPTGLLVLVNGMELSGKGRAVTQLRQWVDPRLLKVEATIGYPALPSQPLWQAHTKALPRHGDVMVYFGNWYADLLFEVMQLIDAKSANCDWHAYLNDQLERLTAFEKDLASNGTKLLKCWFHVDSKTLQARLNDKDADPEQLYQIDWSDSKVLAQFNEVAQQVLGHQDDWIIIDGSEDEESSMAFCHHVLHAMQWAVKSSQSQAGKPQEKAQKNQLAYQKPKHEFIWADVPDELIDVNDSDMDKSDYKSELAQKQAQLAKLLRSRGNRHVVFAFEGMDAAGKGGAIKRLVAPLDPREYQIYNIGAPMRYELDHPYLWRFWTKLPNAQTDRISRIAIFDRTWYGRVLVERIEGFATEQEWQRAYDEINRFEADLAASGTIVIKYWLAIDKKEQLARFEAREETLHKQFKLTEDDWRNRDRWQDYVQAASDMLLRTNTSPAPWCMVATNDKRTARLMVLDHAIAQLTKLLKPALGKKAF
ncbi:MAG: ATPase [Psychrobacter sp.]|nr:ATPase [Psychrobacter sp.]